MEIIAVIDKILQMTVVRWALLVATSVLLVSLIVQTVRLKANELLLSAEKGENATYAAKLTAQNDAIKKAYDDMELFKKQLYTANMKAVEIANRLKKREADINKIKLAGTCEEMVQQVIDEVRK